MIVLLSLGAALCYAVASVLQHRAAVAEPAEHSMRASLLLRLVRRPLWLLGRLIDTGGYALHAAALHTGSLVVVEPLLCVGLLFALPLGMVSSRARMTARDWLGATSLTAGLALFVMLSPTTSARDTAPASRWAPTLVAIVLAGAVLVRLARRQSPARRAALLAASAGCLFALTAALTKSALARWSDGVFHLLAGWELYLLILIALVGSVAVQSAFQAGPLAASLPTLTAVEPVVGALLGVALFQERLVRRPAFAVPLPVVFAAIGYGILVLGRSPVVAQDHDPARPRPA